MGLSKFRPSIDFGTWCPLPVGPLLRRAVSVRLPEGSRPVTRCHLRPGAATSRTRSALAVSHGFDGLLHLALCRSVAPCCRSWGSPCFRSVEACRSPDAFLLLGDAEVGERSRFPDAVLPLPKGRRSGVLSPTLSLGSFDPEGSHSLSRRGSLTCLLDLSRWRSTLRSVPLVRSCSTSTVLFSRTPDDPPFAGLTRFGGSCLKRWSALWLGSPQSLPSRRCSRGLPASLFPSQAMDVCLAGVCRSLDLKAFVR